MKKNKSDKGSIEELTEPGEALTPWAAQSETPKGFEIISRPPIVPLKDMPLGAVLDFTLTGVQDSTNPEMKTPILIGKLTADGSRVGIAAQASIANVLLPGWTKDEDKAESFCPFIGRRILLKKAGYRNSEKFKKKFAIYEVAAGPA